MNKKKWEKPKLIVLVRGKTEEFVLTQCKDSGVVGSSSTDLNGCFAMDWTNGGGQCGACVTLGPS